MKYILIKLFYTERTILLKDLKFWLDTDQKNNSLLNYQNNYVKRSNQLLEYHNFLQYYSLFLRFQQNYFDGPAKF